LVAGPVLEKKKASLVIAFPLRLVAAEVTEEDIVRWMRQTGLPDG
jgi:hypothetical protein